MRNKRVRDSTTAAPWIGAMIRALDERGTDGRALALDAGVTNSQIGDPRSRVPQETMTRVWRRAVEATGDDAFGLDVARHVTPSTFGVLTHLAFVSANLEMAFNRVIRFQRLMTDSLQLRLVRDGAQFRLTVDPVHPEHPPAEEIDAFFATWTRVVRGLTWPRVEPVRMNRRRIEPSATRVFERVFRCPIRFGAEEDFLAYDIDDCRRLLPDHNLELAQQYEQILAKEAAALANATVAERVRALLFETLPDRPTASVVAKCLSMSRSALKSALTSESTSYKTILEDVRRTLAGRYLREDAYSIKEVAFLLGYADSSTFSRAFKSWTGASPRLHASSGDPPRPRERNGSGD
jgi:AraC-like DNA-binding protein